MISSSSILLTLTDGQNLWAPTDLFSPGSGDKQALTSDVTCNVESIQNQEAFCFPSICKAQGKVSVLTLFLSLDKDKSLLLMSCYVLEKFQNHSMISGENLPSF